MTSVHTMELGLLPIVGLSIVGLFLLALLCYRLSVAWKEGQEIRAEAARLTEEAKRRREEEKRQGIIDLPLEPGREAFTPVPLRKGQYFKLRVTGVYRYRHWGLWSDADTCYFASHDSPNFDKRYKKFSLDGKCANPCEEDRHTHSYRFPYTGTGRKLCLLLKPPENDRAPTEGTLAVTIAPLSPQEQAALNQQQQERLERDQLARLEAEQAQRAEKQAALRREEEARRREQIARELQQAKQRQEEETKREEAKRRLEVAQEQKLREEKQKENTRREARCAQLQQTVTDLRLRAQLERIYLDPQYRENRARWKTDEVLQTKSQFTTEYRKIMTDPELFSMLTQQAPEVLQWLDARRQLLELAEQIKVAPPPAPPPKRKPTDQDIRNKKAHLVRRAALDKMAEKTMMLDAVRDFEQQLTEYALDDDERQQLVDDFAHELLADQEDDTKQIN